jgi:hypothetical protein
MRYNAAALGLTSVAGRPSVHKCAAVDSAELSCIQGNSIYKLCGLNSAVERAARSLTASNVITGCTEGLETVLPMHYVNNQW